MKLRITYTRLNVSVQRKVVKVYRVTPIGIPNGITTSILTQAGQIIVCIAPGVGSVIAPPVANNQTLISDLTVAGLWKVGTISQASGGLIALTNKDVAQAVAGSVVIADLATDKGFLGTAVPNHLGVIGVTTETIGINSTGNVAIAALADTLVSGNVARGEWLVSSATKWRAKTAGYDKPYFGAIGYALTAYSGGGNGTVQAVVMPEPQQLTSAGTAWAIAGNNGAATATAQKFTVASATWATIAAAAITTAVSGCAGMGFGTTAGYTIGGTTGAFVVTAYKTPFSTEITAAQASANLPAAREGMRSGFNSSTRGYAVGGYNGAAVIGETKLTYATDTMSAALGTNLSLARYYTVGVSNGTLTYAQAGKDNAGVFTGVSDLITVATDVVSDNNAGDVTADAYSGFSFAADNGYMAEKTGATNLSKKIVLATGVSANVTSTLITDQTNAAGISDGNGLAWISGDDAAPYSVSHKFTKATETYATDAGAAFVLGRSIGAYFNNGAI